MSVARLKTSMRILLITLFTASLLSACNLSSGSEMIFDFLRGDQNEVENEQEPTQADQREVPTQEVLDGVKSPPAEWVLNDHGGMALWYDPEVIEDIRATTFSQSQGAPGEVPHPAYVQYSLPLDNGKISVVGIEVYTNMSEAADQIFPKLREMLSNRTALSLNCIPELPLVAFFRQCSHQQFNANVEYIDLKNGAGVRFVTVYGIQDAAPISNEHLVYVYQGITNDRQCYITASFKISHESLDDYGEIPRDVYLDNTGIALAKYFSDYRHLLDDDLEGYVPDLERLDEVMQSIEVVNCLGE